ncbi:hypothetical protein [Maribacter sp. 2304DJ31-5]|uniref:hypothetical protein n=1 Tax=Maribacter sp. 2304DJ31-5 TaxID=3386273 RepID=UPI0039BD38B9
MRYAVGHPVLFGLWHSTISRTRQLFPEDVFEEVSTKVFSLCVESGLVSGHTQVMDSAPVKANASMDSLELKVLGEDLEAHLRKVRHISTVDKERPLRRAKNDRSIGNQGKVTAKDKELRAVKSRNKEWSKDQDQRPGSGNWGSKYTSNKTHYSPVDPDVRISWEGQPTFARYGRPGRQEALAGRSDVGERCRRYGLRQRGELRFVGTSWPEELDPSPRHLQGRPGRFCVCQR